MVQSVNCHGCGRLEIVLRPHGRTSSLHDPPGRRNQRSTPVRTGSEWTKRRLLVGQGQLNGELDGVRHWTITTFTVAGSAYGTCARGCFLYKCDKDAVAIKLHPQRCGQVRIASRWHLKATSAARDPPSDTTNKATPLNTPMLCSRFSKIRLSGVLTGQQIVVKKPSRSAKSIP